MLKPQQFERRGKELEVKNSEVWFQSVRYSKNSISPHCGGEPGVAEEGGSKVGAHGLGDVFVTG